MEKNIKIVNLRALAIFMVVFGHSIIIYDNSFDLLKSDIQVPFLENFKHIISFIQMKLFISISGFLLAYKCLKSRARFEWKDFLKNKIKRLLVPYFFVCLLYNNPIKYALKIPGYESFTELLCEQLLGTNCAHLWYLPCLFILLIVGYVAFIWCNRSLMKHLVLLTMALLLNYYSGYFPLVFQLQSVSYYFLFFYLGYIINYIQQSYPNLLRKISNNIKLEFCIVVLLFLFSLLAYEITSIGFQIFLSIVVVTMFYIIIPTFTNKFVSCISRYSYGIYLFHSPLIYFTAIFLPNINPLLMVLVNFVILGTFAYIVTFCLSKSNFKFIIGE